MHPPFQTKNYCSLIPTFPVDKPITVLHHLRFKDVATYPPSSPHTSLPPISGYDAFYTRYVPAGAAAAQSTGITSAETIFYSKAVTSLLVGMNKEKEEEKDGGKQGAAEKQGWDVIVARRYASWGEYARYQASRVYQEEAAPHRDAALAEWEVFACVEGEPPHA